MDQVPESRQPGGRNAIVYTDSPMYLGAGSRGGFTASALQYEPRPPFLQSAFAVMCLLLATTPIASGTYTRTASYASLHVTPFVAQQWNLCSPPPSHPTHTHTHTKCLSILYASFIPRPHQLSVTWGEPGNKVEATWSYKR